tara:strand:+ start:3443 stop:6463 length:3021 start_codon:yes stop_codon:yes gene_type:complete
MASIDDNTKAEPIVPTGGTAGSLSKTRLNIPVYAGGGVTPQSNFNTPYSGGEALGNTLQNITKIVNKVADEAIIQEGFKRGFNEQSAAKEAGYIGPDTTFTTASQAYQKGANIAFTADKILTAHKQIQKFGNNNEYDPEKFAKLANEYKAEWMGQLPAHLQPELSIKFDDIQNNEFSRRTASKYTLDRAQQFETQDEFNNLALDEFRQAYSADGPKSKGIPGPIATLAAAIPKLIESGATVAQIQASQQKIKQSMIDTILFKDFKDLSTPGSDSFDPTAAEQFIVDVASGKRNLGEVSDTYATLLPLGGVLSPKQRSAAVTVLKHYQREFTTMMAGQKKIEMDNFAAQKANTSSGRAFVRDEKSGMISYQPAIYNESDYKTLSKAEHEKNRRELNEEDQIGKQIFAANTNILAGEAGHIKVLQQSITEINNRSDLDAGTKAYHTEQTNKQIEKVRGAYAARNKAIKDDNLHDWFSKALNITVDGNSDESIDEGNTKLQGITNLPFNIIGVPKAESTAMVQRILSAPTTEILVNQLVQEGGKHPKYFGAMLAKGLSKDSKPEEYAVIGLSDMMGQRPSEQRDVNIKKVSEAFKNRISNQSAHSDKYGDEKARENIADADTQFRKGFPNLEPGSIEYKTIKGFYSVNFYRNHMDYDGKAQINNSEAITRALASTLEQYPEVNTVLGPVNVPLFIAQTNDPLDNLDSAAEKINKGLANPALAGIVMAPGTTYENFEDNRDNGRMRVRYSNPGTLVVKSQESREMLSVFQKLPGEGTGTRVSDVRWTIGKNSNGPTQDVDPTKNYPNDPKWANGFKFDNTALRTTEFNSESAEFEEIYGNKTNDEYGAELRKYMAETLPISTDGGPVGDFDETTGKGKYLYEDNFVRNLVTDEKIKDTTTLQGISLLLKNGKIDKPMLNYLGSVSPYMSQFMKSEAQQEAVIDSWNKNHPDLLQRKTIQDVPTSLTPLASLTAMLVELPKRVRTQAEVEDMAKIKQFSTMGSEVSADGEY